MKFTATQIRLPANVSVQPGQIVRFDPMGAFLSVVDSVRNGLATMYQANADGTFSRYFF